MEENNSNSKAALGLACIALSSFETTGVVAVRGDSGGMHVGLVRFNELKGPGGNIEIIMAATFLKLMSKFTAEELDIVHTIMEKAAGREIEKEKAKAEAAGTTETTGTTETKDEGTGAGEKGEEAANG